MSISHVLTDDAVLRLPPMLFGRIRWLKSIGAPVGDPATGFKVQSEEHTVSKFQVGAGGIEVVRGTGIWKPPIPVPCYVAPDEGDKHVAAFSVPDVHLTGFPDGRFRVSVELTGNWSESRLQMMLGYKRIEPMAYYVTLTKEQHLVSLDFEVVQEPWRFSRCEQKAGRSSAVEAGEPKELEGRWWAGTGLNCRPQDFQFSTSTGRIAHLLS